MVQQWRVFISGRVQGVGFRAFTVREVRHFPAIKGYVRNLEDGRVEAVFAGPADEVRQIISRLKRGPSASQVDHLESKEEPCDPHLPAFDVTESN